ncbi:MAG TPA: trypsin-like serine protease [Kofleriaceae bacterium]|nr:trypsin-like serine protease [Kofleriaceae bacterium]
MARRAGTGAVVALAIALVDGALAVAAPAGAGEPVVGGESSDPGEYPATGALVRGVSYRCTATLIAPDVAITAAHCLVDEGFGDFSFTLDPDLNDDLDGLVPVIAFHQHPYFHSEGDFNELAQRNDLGVFILERPIESIAPESLGDMADNLSLTSGSEMQLCGYGRDTWADTSSDGVKRDALVHVDMMTPWELQSADEDPQPCRGDSGGPVFVETAGGRRIAGVVSRAVGGERMCSTGAIYTRVAPYLAWVETASLDRDMGGCSATRGSGCPWLALLGSLALVGRRRARR